MEINILILSVGTRNKIVQYLKKALTDQEGNKLPIIAPMEVPVM